MNDETFFESESESEVRRRRGFPRANPRFPAPKPPLGRPRPPVPPRRRPVRRVPVGFGFPAPIEVPAPSDFIRTVQSDLAEALGMAIPVTGILSAATRRALRIFQSRMGLPVTGDVSGSTLRALRRTLSTRRSSPVFDDSAPPAGSAWLPEPAPPADGAPPEAGDEPEPGAGGGEEPQEEYRIIKPGAIQLTRYETVSVADVAAKRKSLPSGKGIYVIHDGSGPWYVGISNEGIAGRFTGRFSALKDFKLGSSTIPADLKITGYELSGYAPLMAAWYQKNGLSPGATSKATPKGVNSALEAHFIKALGTAAPAGGNIQAVKATIARGVTASLQIAAAKGTASAGPGWESRLGTQLSLPVV